jgi:hypothetical protein
MSSPLTVLRFSCWHFSEAAARHQRRFRVFFGFNLKRTLAGDEGDELAHAFLHTFFRFFGNLGVFGQSHFHDPGDWGKVVNVSILIKVFAIRMLGTMWLGWRGG